MHLMLGEQDETLEEFMDTVIEESDKEEVDALIKNEFSDIVHEYGFDNVLAGCVAMIIAAWQGEVREDDEPLN